MLLAVLVSCSAERPTPVVIPQAEIVLGHARRSERALPVRARPHPEAPLRGYVAAGASFWVHAPADGPGCASGWARTEAMGYLCMDETVRVEEPPQAWPEVLSFDPPRPSEFDEYIHSGQYDHDSPEPLTPAVYAKRWKRFEGKLYASLDAFLAGEEPVSQLMPGAGHKYRFEEIVETDKGPVLTREDGRVARLDDVYLYPISRLRGQDLREAPLPEGTLPAFAVAPDGAPLRPAPDASAPVALVAPYHSPLAVRGQPGDPWWRVEGPGELYVQAEHVRHPTPSPARPEGAGDQELWVDVDLRQQALMVRQGDALVYFTLVSSGAGAMPTPIGTWQIFEKHGLKDMVSRPGAADTYRVEDVPWTMVWKPRYSLHTAYWHWGFGRTASHGCVNLTPQDARWLYEHVGAQVPEGWKVLVAREDEGGVVRVRRGDDVGEDHRAELGLLREDDQS
jgi:hypothetical protein